MRQRQNQSKDNPPTEIRTCKTCHREKRFYWDKTGSRWLFKCNSCHSKRRWANPAYRKKARNYQSKRDNHARYLRDKAGPSYAETRRKYRLLHPRSNAKSEIYKQMFEQQRGVCAICKQPETVKHGEKVSSLALDHDHHTGENRALLCHGCNVSLGLMREDPERIRAMADYIELHRNKTS